MKLPFITGLILLCVAGIKDFASSAEMQAKLENHTPFNGHTTGISSQTAVPAHFVDPGGHVILVEKSTQKLYLYDRDYKIVREFHVTTGQRPGDKKKIGDLRTPEGVYFFTVVKDDSKLLPEYGVMALPINYPNLIDTVLRKGGNGIWLHATDQPTRPLKPYDTRGCVVAANEDILELAEYIKLQITPVVIVEKIEYGTLEKTTEIRREIQRFTEKWKTGWEEKDIKTYIDSYSKRFRANGMDFTGWKKYKERLNSQNKNIHISMSDMKILRHDSNVVVSFIQQYKNNRLTSTGIKRLYLAMEDGGWKIIGEEWAPLPTEEPATIARRYLANGKRTGIINVKTIPEQSSEPIVKQASIDVQKETAHTYQTPILDIEDFMLKKEQTASIRFKLVNKTGEKHKISGRLAVVAANEDEFRYTAYPPMSLEQGIPKDFRKGEWFSIRRFKVVSAAVAEKEINFVSVLVYSKEGELLLNKKIHIQ